MRQTARQHDSFTAIGDAELLTSRLVPVCFNDADSDLCVFSKDVSRCGGSVMKASCPDPLHLATRNSVKCVGAVSMGQI